MRKSRYLKIAANRPVPVRGALVHVDATPIRRAAAERYEEAKERFAEAQRSLERFHDLDKPQFERWLQATFGKLVGDLRGAQGELNRLRELIFEVETRTWFNSQSCAAAYRDVLERQDRRRDNPGGPDPDDLEEKMRAHLEAEARDEKEEARADTPAGRAARLGPEKEHRLKAAYRSMARRLHPDRHAHVTPQMRERWHAAQQAYLAGDVDLLESLETLCLSEEGDISAHTAVSLILDRTRHLHVSITQLGVKIQHGKKDPAWAFSELTDFAPVKRRMAQSLPEQTSAARNEIAALEEKIAQWHTDAERFYPGFAEAHPLPSKKKEKREARKEAPRKPAKPAPKPQGRGRAASPAARTRKGAAKTAKAPRRGAAKAGKK